MSQSAALSRRLAILAWLLVIFLVWQEAAFVLADVLKDKMASKTLPYLHLIILNLFEKWRNRGTPATVFLPRAGK